MADFLFFRSYVLAYMHANRNATIADALAAVVEAFYVNLDFLPDEKDVAAAEAWRASHPLPYIPPVDDADAFDIPF